MALLASEDEETLEEAVFLSLLEHRHRGTYDGTMVKRGQRMPTGTQPQRPSKDTIGFVGHFAALTAAIARKRDLNEILLAFTDFLPALLPFHRTSISVLTGGRRTTWNLFRDKTIEEIVETSASQANSLVEIVMRQQGLVIIEDIGKSDLHVEEEEQLLQLGSRSIASYPLVLDGRTIGTMDVEADEPYAYSKDDEPLMALIAGQIAIALDRANVFRAEQRHLEDVKDQLILAGKHSTVAQLATTMSHEIKNHFNAIKLGAHFLQTQLPSGQNDQARVMASMVHAAERGAGLLKNFLDYAQPMPTRPEAVYLVPLLQDAVALSRCSRIQVQWALADDVMGRAVWADRNQLSQVFVNLMLNAFDAMPEGGVLQLGGRVLDHSVEVSVSDTGIGIRPEDQPHIFEPFYSTKKTGTGLGMSISKSIIENNGGTISFESTPGKGTTFYLCLQAVNKQ